MTGQLLSTASPPEHIDRSSLDRDSSPMAKVVDVGCSRMILGDVLEVLASLDSDKFDLAIVDPPYGASSKSAWHLRADHELPGFGGEWKLSSSDWDRLTGASYLRWSLAWLAELKRVVRPTGSIWLHSSYHNSGILNVACQSLGLEIINEVVWAKRNSFPNLSGRRLTASHETLLWVHTGGRRRQYRFNYPESKAYSDGGDSFKKAGFQMRTVWDLPNNKTKEELKFGSHPTQKPLRLLNRLVAISGLENGSLIIPFSGSGSAVIAGLRGRMKPTAIEQEPTYFEKSVEWVRAESKSSKQMRLHLDSAE